MNSSHSTKSLFLRAGLVFLVNCIPIGSAKVSGFNLNSLTSVGQLVLIGAGFTVTFSKLGLALLSNTPLKRT